MLLRVIPPATWPSCTSARDAGLRHPEPPNNSLKPWEITRIPVKTSGTNGLRLTPREERRGPSAGGPGLKVFLSCPPTSRRVTGGCLLPPGSFPPRTWDLVARGR